MKAASPYFLRAPPHVRSRTSIGFRVDFYQNRVAARLEKCTHFSDKGEKKKVQKKGDGICFLKWMRFTAHPGKTPP